jgi:hypothetical protein
MLENREHERKGSIMDWITVLNLCLAVLAIALSGVALLAARRDRRLDAYIRVDEYLNSEMLQRGRRLIYGARERGVLPAEDSDDFSLILRAFGAMNAVARWSRLGLVDQRAILEEWHHELRGMWTVFESVLALRSAWHDFNPWPDLDDLIGIAEAYRSDRQCCTGPTLKERSEGKTGLLRPA